MTIVSSFDAVTHRTQNMCFPAEAEKDLAQKACETFSQQAKPNGWYYLGGIACVILGILFLFISFIHGVIFFFLGWSIIYGVRYSFMKDVAKYRVAQAKGWLYDPEPRGIKGDEFAIKCSLRGGHARYVEDQIWTPKLYAGEFVHTVGSGKSSHTERYSYVGVPAKLPVEFTLRPQGWEIFDGDQELQLESEQFNKTFEFTYKGSKEDMGQQITQILTPAMQVELCDLAKQEGPMTIAFTQDCIFFISQRLLYRPSFESVLRLAVTDDDVARVEADLEIYVQFANRISSEWQTTS